MLKKFSSSSVYSEDARLVTTSWASTRRRRSSEGGTYGHVGQTEPRMKTHKVMRSWCTMLPVVVTYCVRVISACTSLVFGARSWRVASHGRVTLRSMPASTI